MSGRPLAVKTIQNSLLNVASFLIGLLVNFYLLRFVVTQIGIEYFGISTLLFVIIAPLNLANLGFGEATTKYVAEHVYHGRFEKAGAFIRTTFFMNLVIGLIGFLLLFFLGGSFFMWAFSSQVSVNHGLLVKQCMRIVALGWLVNQCSATFMGVPVAIQQFRKVAIGSIISILVTAISVYQLLINGAGLLGYTLGIVLGQIAGLVYWFISTKRIIPGVSLMPRIDREAWKQSFHYGGWQTITQLGGILAQQSEKYIMGVMLSTASVGIYSVALQIEQKVYAIVHKLSEVLFPIFSALSSDSEERKANILIKASWITTSIAVCLLASIIPFAHPLILLWMKNTELANKGTVVLQVICAAGIFGSATTAGYFFLLGIGKTRKITYVSLLTGIVTVISAVFILPRYGLAGAGWSGLCGLAAQSVAITRVMRTTLKKVTPLSAIITAIYAPILVALCLAILITLINPWPIDNWFHLGIAYAFTNIILAVSIFMVTRILPHGKEHEELLKKLFSHMLNKLRLRFTK